MSAARGAAATVSVITTSSTGEDAAQATRSATDRFVDSSRRSNRAQSQVYFVSHRGHVRLHRDRRMNRAGCPQLGPSPWKVGVSTPKHSATISQDPASLAGRLTVAGPSAVTAPPHRTG